LAGTFEIGLEFELIGILVGVGIYNSIILDIPFPMVVYKRLKGNTQPLTVEDLAELDPRLGKSLGEMLRFQGDVQATFCASFEVAVEEWGEWKTHELVPGGSEIPVTNENVADYVQRYVQWVLVDSVKGQFDAFAKGFMKVCGGQALEMFRPKELELLVCGNPVLDFEALERATTYDDGFDDSCQTIRFFWQVITILYFLGLLFVSLLSCKCADRFFFYK
jgi:ubiquitin-protein ligase E3 A